MNTKKLFAFLAVGLLVIAVACGGDDDDDAAPASGGASDSAPAASSSGGDDDSSDDDGGDENASDTSDSSGSSESVGTVTVGDETWNLVADQCDATEEGGLTIYSIAGHAESDDAIEILIDFDPRDTGLVLSVQAAGGDPSWFALNETFTVSAGGPVLRGTGSYAGSEGGPAEAEGSFDIRC